MFVYNLKLNSSIFYKLILFIIVIIVISLCVFIGIKIFKESKYEDSCNITNDIVEITDKNYANILQMVHNDIDTYIGQKIKFSGFVYRVYDLKNNQFVLGRNMIISSDHQTVVIGFLCNYDGAIMFKDSTWVELEGTITKGTYHNSDIPILEITSIKEINKPKEEYVYPPDEDYIPTSVIL